MPTGVMEVALAELGPSLVSGEAAELIRQRAEPLPAAHWAGVEIRLSPGVEPVDFHLGIHQHDARRVLAGIGETAGLETLAEFCAEWSDPSSELARGISYVVLEFDLHHGSSPVPAIFIAFGEQRTAEERFATAREVVSRFYGHGSPLAGELERCFTHCRGGEVVTHIGLMLSRRADTIRVNVRNLSHDRFPAYLRDVGYGYDTGELERCFARYLRFVDRATVCLDVGARVLPRVGLECTLLKPPAEDFRHRIFLNRLVQQGLCSDDKAEAVLAWPGVSTPVHHIDRWPEHLLVQSVAAAPGVFSAATRTISHIKIDCQPDGAVSAKAYLGIEHVWLEPGKKVEAADAPTSTDDARDLDRAIDDAVDHLARARHQSGWWRDYPGFLAPTDEFLTAYVGWVLGSIDHAQAREAAEEAWRLLAACTRPGRGWGWSASVASDADSTAWALRLANRVGAGDTEEASAAERFLRLHLRPGGGVATYEEAHFQDFNRGKQNADSSLAAWCEPHVCVTSAAVHALGATDAELRFLRHTQEESGLWRGYWWPDAEFGTALAVSALYEHGGPEDRRSIHRAAAWAAARVTSDGSVASEHREGASAFATASCLSTLSYALMLEEDDALRGLAEGLAGWLTRHQKRDGSWQPSALMYADPEGEPGRIEVDVGGIHTTATALRALSLYREVARG